MLTGFDLYLSRFLFKKKTSYRNSRSKLNLLYYYEKSIKLKEARTTTQFGKLRWEEKPDFLVTWGWNVFCFSFKLSQWEALTLAIRHEYEKELEKDSSLLEMDKAIEALKNS